MAKLKVRLVGKEWTLLALIAGRSVAYLESESS